MSYVDMREGIDLYEYYRLLAVALKAEEYEQFNLATLVAIGVNNPKYLKKWKWQYSDKSGANSFHEDTPMKSVTAFAASKVGNLSQAASGSGLAYAQATGRPYVFMDTNGNLFNIDGSEVEMTPDTVIVKMDADKSMAN